MSDETVVNRPGNGFPWPVAIMSFNRPILLAGVLRDLRSQTIKLNDEQVYLFQDGVSDQFDGKALAEESTKAMCIALFKEAFPRGHVMASETNLGIAFNFERAERITLGSLGADAAAFFEDDMALSPGYLEVLATLLSFALSEPKVGYVAAYGDHHASFAQQSAQQGKIVPMHHKWGFGLTKRQWERQQPIVDPYLRLLEGKNYLDRDHKQIREYFGTLGYGSMGSSQDAAKDVAGSVLGTTKLMSYVCYGKYLGEWGVHQRPEDYRKAGYAETILFPTIIKTFDYPTVEHLDAMIVDERRIARAVREIFAKS